MYDLVFVTHIPAFYKVNLYNEISKKNKIYVIFIAQGTSEMRTEDFTKLDNALFDFVVINITTFQNRNILKSCYMLLKYLRYKTYNRVIVSGWDLPEFWLTAILITQSKFSLALESTIYESKTTGLAFFLKTIFLRKVSLVFASGKRHYELLKALKYDGETRITNGVGIINKPKFLKVNKKYSKSFLFVGRISEEKNLLKLVSIFNSLPDFKLTIIGTGPLEKEIIKTALSNIKLLGNINNNNISEYYTHHDFLILPSLREPWGLVVEEALYFGTPVIISEQCGASELISNGLNGFVFDAMNPDYLKQLLKSINNETYSALNIINNINDKDSWQVSCYM